MQLDLGVHGVFSKDRFLTLFGSVYEHSPWVAETVFESLVDTPVTAGMATVDEVADQVSRVGGDQSGEERVGDTRVGETRAGDSQSVETQQVGIWGCESLVQRFEQVFLSSSKTQQLEVLRAHPELACQRALPEKLTAASQLEQRGSGLDQCSEQELKLFLEYNYKYMNKNNFPFIVAVKGLSRSDILQLFKKRLANDRDTEFEVALQQVNRIAGFRIEAILHA